MSEEPQNLPLVLPPEPKPKRAPTLYFIIAFKLLKGSMALLLAWSISRLRDDNHDGLPDELPTLFHKLIRFFHVDPERKFVIDLAKHVAEITQKDLHWVVVFLAVYVCFMLLQAVGLAFHVGWVVWLVIVESALLVPVEVFELVNNPSWIKLGILTANVAIVWYLFANRARLIRHHHHQS